MKIRDDLEKVRNLIFRKNGFDVTFQLNSVTTYTAARTISLPKYDANCTIASLSDKLSVFAATTSAELAGVISDEVGVGYLVFNDAPTFTTSILSPIVYGSAASGGTLDLQSTSHSTKGNITLGCNGLLNGTAPTVLGSTRFLIGNKYNHITGQKTAAEFRLGSGTYYSGTEWRASTANNAGSVLALNQASADTSVAFEFRKYWDGDYTFSEDATLSVVSLGYITANGTYSLGDISATNSSFIIAPSGNKAVLSGNANGQYMAISAGGTQSVNISTTTSSQAMCYVASGNEWALFMVVPAAASVVIISQSSGNLFMTGAPTTGKVGLTTDNTTTSKVIFTTYSGQTANVIAVITSVWI